MTIAPTWDAVTQVRVKEHLYTGFKKALRNFPSNQQRFKGKYVPKVWDVKGTFHNNRYLMFENLVGCYRPSWFHALTAKKQSDMLKRVVQMYKESANSYSHDTHEQSVNYVFHKSAQGMEVDPVQAIEDGGLYDRDSDVTMDAACYSGMNERFSTAISNEFDMLTGYFFIDEGISVVRAKQYVDALRGWKLLDNEIKTHFVLDENAPDYDRVVYSIKFRSDCMRYDKLYFQFSLLRFLLEYHGTLNIMFDLMDEFNMALPMAMVMAMHWQPNKRWLHVPWTTSGEHSDMETVMKWTLGIMDFAPGRGLYDFNTANFKSSPLVASHANKFRDKKWRDMTDIKYIQTLNKRVEEVQK